MRTIKTIFFILGIPIYILSIMFLLISIIGFGWGEGVLNTWTLIPIGLLALSGYLFRKIALTDKAWILALSIIVFFTSVFSAFGILSSMAA